MKNSYRNLKICHEIKPNALTDTGGVTLTLHELNNSAVREDTI